MGGEVEVVAEEIKFFVEDAIEFGIDEVGGNGENIFYL